jgi:hypothetical protein
MSEVPFNGPPFQSHLNFVAHCGLPTIFLFFCGSFYSPSSINAAVVAIWGMNIKYD